MLILKIYMVNVKPTLVEIRWPAGLSYMRSYSSGSTVRCGHYWRCLHKSSLLVSVLSLHKPVHDKILWRLAESLDSDSLELNPQLWVDRGSVLWSWWVV